MGVGDFVVCHVVGTSQVGNYFSRARTDIFTPPLLWPVKRIAKESQELVGKQETEAQPSIQTLRKRFLP
jgi:hypothetical protein